MFLKISQNSQENICAGVSFLIKLKTRPQICNLITKEKLTQLFSYEFCEIFKNTFFKEYLCATASAEKMYYHQNIFKISCIYYSILF